VLYEFELKITDDNGNVFKETRIVTVHHNEKASNEILP
jgi:hypothetical protein